MVGTVSVIHTQTLKDPAEMAEWFGGFYCCNVRFYMKSDAFAKRVEVFCDMWIILIHYI